jgi:hypothetical protein
LSCPFDSETRTLVIFDKSDEPDKGGGETNLAFTAKKDLWCVGVNATRVAGLVLN